MKMKVNVNELEAYAINYTFDAGDKVFIAAQVRKYSIPCDRNGFIYWNPGSSTVCDPFMPISTIDWIKYMGNKPENADHKKCEDAVRMLELRHLGAYSSYRNLMRDEVNNKRKSACITMLLNIMKDCKEMIEHYKNRMGLDRYDNMKYRKWDEYENPMFQFFV